MMELVKPPRAAFKGESDLICTWSPWKPKYEIAAKKSPKGESKGRPSAGCSSPRGKPSEETFTRPLSKEETVTRVLRLRAILIVTGSISAIGSAMALISHVPPASTRQGAEASIERDRNNFLTDKGMETSYSNKRED